MTARAVPGLPLVVLGDRDDVAQLDPGDADTLRCLVAAAEAFELGELAAELRLQLVELDPVRTYVTRSSTSSPDPKWQGEDRGDDR